MTRKPELDRACQMACRMLLKGWDGSLPVEPLTLLKKCRDTRVMTVEEAQGMLDSLRVQLTPVEGLTIRGERQGRPHYLVVYDSGGSRERRRFSLAHELGHRALDHQEMDAGGKRWATAETEANRFASTLLCPGALVRLMQRRLHPLYLEQVAWICGISRAAAQMAWASRHERREMDEALMAFYECGLENRLKMIPSPKENWTLLSEERCERDGSGS